MVETLLVIIITETIVIALLVPGWLKRLFRISDLDFRVVELDLNVQEMKLRVQELRAELYESRYTWRAYTELRGLVTTHLEEDEP